MVLQALGPPPRSGVVEEVVSMGSLSNAPLRLITSQDGSTAVFVAGGMVAFLATVALAVDVGMLLGSRTESQRAADSAALAGAASFITAPTDADRPRAWAIDYAQRHTVNGTLTDVRAEDVDVLMAERKVRVRVRNIAARGNAISTIFARVLGWDEVNVGTSAAAEVTPAGSGNCPLPLALPDRWTENDADNLWDGPPTDLYISYSGPVPSDGSLVQCPDGTGSSGVGCDFTGYYDENVNSGELIEIKTSGGGAGGGTGNSICTDPASWRCWYQPYAIDGGPGGGGANALGPWIEGCPDETVVIHGPPNPTIIHAASGSGNEQSLVEHEFKDLVDNNPGQWNPTNPGGACATSDGGDGPCLGSGNPRIRFMPLIDPTQVSGSGSNVTVPVAALACVFVDKVAQDPNRAHGQGPPGRWNVYMRLTDSCTGLAGGGGPILKALRLVE
jgi:Flp pilus assembly protein TadG